MDEIKVELAEMLGGYFRVIIDGLPIAQCGDWDQANALVEHFIEINEDKNIVRI